MDDNRRPQRRTTSSSSSSRSSGRQSRPRTTSSSRGTRPSSARSSSGRTRTASSSRQQHQGQASRQSSNRRPSSAQRNRQRRQQAGMPLHPEQQRSSLGLTQQETSNLIAGAVGVLVLAVFLLFIFHPWKYKVEVNGTEVTVKRNATLGDIVEAGYATPTPGNLLAIDGELAKEGAGHPFEATVDGEASHDPETVVPKHAVVEISDGKDATEDTEVSESPIPHGERTWNTSIDGYWTGSLHVYEEGEDGVSTTTTGKVSGKTVTEQTKAPIDSGYHIYTCNPGEDKVVALTFDDGPWPDTTDAILDVLEENGAKATFFTIGNQIPEYTAQIQREKALGCLVCTHSYDHAGGSGQGVNLTYMSSEEQIWEVQQGYAAIADALGEEPVHIMRAPGGNFYGDLISTLQPYLDAEIGWDVDTEDWRLPGSDAIYERLMSVKPGQVVLMHDGGGDRTQTVEAVRQAVPELIAQGYRLVTVDELLAYDPPVEGAAVEVG